ncbi:hypothetical protein J4411_00710 [Candidatus Pacearchaeota archaeon]|nr:hypothetical protein [uncultured archaeon]AQS34672.1 hypothetical protein [uncultured archaeon]MBS3084417.1 hypothetical protein [Candidatus Pacearchaeota archaeon]
MKKEDLIETIEILSDYKTMRGISKGLEDYRKGRFKMLNEFKIEMKKAPK